MIKQIMNKLNDFQARQVLLLKKIINQYEIQKLEIISLTKNIQFLINVLDDDKDWNEKIDKNWIEKMNSLNFELEIIYAINAAENEELLANGQNAKPLSDKDISEINAIIVQLKELVEQQISLIPEPEY